MVDESEVEVKRNLQREVDPMAFMKKEEEEEEKLPQRGTGRRTGTAKKPTGPKDRLTEEERRKRHKRVTKT